MFGNYKFITIEKEYFNFYNTDLKLFEHKMVQKYPLGNDSFTINHGDNYFSFFQRLGEVYYFLIVKEKQIIGTGCAILRECGNNKFWYLCDLKISKEHRGQNLTIGLFVKMFWKFFFKVWQGYLISMDPNSSQIVHIFNKIKNLLYIDIKNDKLLIYSLPKEHMETIEKYLEPVFGKITYLSLAGKKDLVISSTNRAIDLYHLQHGPLKIGTESSDFLGAPMNFDLQSSRGSVTAKENTKILKEIPDGATIMFCLNSNSPLVNILEKYNITTNISATIISYRMDFFDWNNILTSDI